MAKTNILDLTKTSWRCLEDIFWRRKAKANIFVLIKASSRRLHQDECLLGSALIISLPLEGIIGSTFRKKWKIKAMVLSKSIIGSHYKELGFTWLFCFHFAENVFKTLLFPCIREKSACPTIYTHRMYG